MSVTLQLARRFLTEVDLDLLWKFAFNFGIKGVLSVQRFKSRLKKGIHFPPFLYISIINSCQLRCQGCWVDVGERRQMIERDDLNRLIREAKKHGNSFFGILGGEPLMHPDLLDVLSAHRDCYFQIFTNGQLLTPSLAKELRRLGNVTPLISIEGSEVVSDQRRGGKEVLNKTLAGLRNCVDQKLIVGVATSVCQTNYGLVSEELAPASDRHGSDVRLVSYLPCDRPEAVSRTGPHAGTGPPAQMFHGQDPANVAHRHRGRYWDDKGKRCAPWPRESVITSVRRAPSSRARSSSSLGNRFTRREVLQGGDRLSVHR